MRVAITGIAGFIGGCVARELLRADEAIEIVGIDNLSRGGFPFLMDQQVTSSGRVSLAQVDILDSEALIPILDETDVVVHLAGLPFDRRAFEQAHIFDQVNNWGTASVVRAVRAAEIRRMVFVSSLAVFGFPMKKLQKLDTPVPVEPYGRSKLDAERHVDSLREYVEEIHILRLGNVYGISPEASFDSTVNRIIRDAKYKNRVVVEGSGAHLRPVLTVEDAASEVANAACRNKSAQLVGPSALFTESISENSIVEIVRQSMPDLDVIRTNLNTNLPSLDISLSLSAISSGTTAEQRIPEMLDRLI